GFAHGALTASAVGPSHLDDERLQRVGRTFRQALRELRDGPGGETQLFVLWGKHSRDRPSAELLAQEMGAVLLEISDPESKVYHNAVFALAQQHRLEAILSALLYGGGAALDRLRRIPTLEVQVVERSR